MPLGGNLWGWPDYATSGNATTFTSATTNAYPIWVDQGSPSPAARKLGPLDWLRDQVAEMQELAHA